MMLDNSAPQSPRGMDLLLATNELQAVVHRLTGPLTSYINNTYLERPGLYVQLYVALDSCRSNAASSAARSRPPVWTDALDVKRELDTFIDSLPYGCAGRIGTQINELARRHWVVDEIRELRWLTRKLDRFATDIERLINADHVKEIIAACPACGEAWFERLDGAGVTTWTRTLQVSAEYGCTCQACGYHWAPNQLLELAISAGLPTPEGVTR